ncbi:hypothetical protein DBR32_05330 [Taibaiella sp. KBW10]|uniref:glycosyltransferase family 87 protein n=1 Tax=Taibaiella sp. KBW10 TaxID=2153357 RepID=UPI000F5AC343|nr:glycosyltransferase family 87 protein [Taibaiella sp. KBW10]RQO31387.1 hypothetical protein DBR32_05330 [Taibaiella sp. KBW10]
MKANNAKLRFALKPAFVIPLCLLITIVVSCKQYYIGMYGNHLTFKKSFWDAIHHHDLYRDYSGAFLDSFHYGPLFTILYTPFALLPDLFGMTLWNLANVGILLWGIYKLPIKPTGQSIIVLLCLNELVTAILGFQFNVAITGLILLAFSYTLQDKPKQTTFAIVLGTLTKIYGITALAFLLFTKRKWQYLLWGIIWAIFLFFLPMLFLGADYVAEMYVTWFGDLAHKNEANASLITMQDISLVGMIRRITGNGHISQTPFILIGMLLYAIPLFKTSLYSNARFRLLLLSSTLIFTVIFSSSSESPTYIIAFVGVAVWFVSKRQYTNLDIILVIFAILLTSLSATDLFPKAARVVVRQYSLKALPCVLIWLKIIYEMLTHTEYTKTDQNDIIKF